jgi:molybdenum cofactor cytidylyltransferase
MRKKVGIVILAAGGSTRFGQPKQLFEYQGESLVRRAASTALNVYVGPVVVSVGAENEAIENELAGLDATCVFNPDWRSGMSSSLKSALTYLSTAYPDLDAVLFLLCDQPHVTSTKLNELIDTYQETDALIVAAEYSDIVGVPALFDRKMFSELQELSGDEGARSVIKKYAGQVHRVPMPEAAFDIDSMSDIENR